MVFLNKSVSAAVGELSSYRHGDMLKVEEFSVITELFLSVFLIFIFLCKLVLLSYKKE
jgi:hypothetical protein